MHPTRNTDSPTFQIKLTIVFASSYMTFIIDTSKGTTTWKLKLEDRLGD